MQLDFIHFSSILIKYILKFKNQKLTRKKIDNYNQ